RSSEGVPPTCAVRIIGSLMLLVAWVCSRSSGTLRYWPLELSSCASFSSSSPLSLDCHEPWSRSRRMGSQPPGSDFKRVLFGDQGRLRRAILPIGTSGRAALSGRDVSPQTSLTSCGGRALRGRVSGGFARAEGRGRSGATGLLHFV